MLIQVEERDVLGPVPASGTTKEHSFSGSGARTLLVSRPVHHLGTLLGIGEGQSYSYRGNLRAEGS